MNAKIETRIEIVGGVSVVNYNIYIFDDRFPEKSAFHKRLVATVYDREHAKNFQTLLNKQRS